MNLRAFLEQREKELMERIAELHAKLAPLETDLAIFNEAMAVVNRPIKQFRVGESACGEPLAEYADSPASTGLRQFLTGHEEELTAQIKGLRDNLLPLEGELAEVRRAEAAIGMPQWNGDFNIYPSCVVHESRFGHPTLQEVPKSAYAGMTMKQLIVKVLHEHFHDGATTRQMLDFFRDAWGRNIERTNLSPQLSRLAHDGIIERQPNRTWRFTAKGQVATELKVI